MYFVPLDERSSKLAAKRYLSLVLTGCMILSTTFPPAVSSAAAQTAANANAQALDKLLAPIALYPDPLLAQVLACATSPDQVTEVHKWLQENKTLQGTQLQEAATTKGFDASFTALVLFPDVLDTMAKNVPWTTELGKAFLSDQQSVLDSVQRLRKQAQTIGNLKTTEQQQVKTETQDGTQVIVIQPANPQIVYVPVYNTTTVYTSPPPPPPKDDSGDKAAAAIIGFAVGIAIGSAMNDNYYSAPYGWGAWGVGWHSHTVVVAGGAAWRVPPGGRYPYTRPVPRASYRAPVNINAPTYNINVDRSHTVNNVNRSQGNTTPRPTQGTARPATQPSTQPAARPATQPATQPAARPTTQPATQPAARPSTSATNTAKLGSSGAGSGGAAVTQSRAGTKSGAFSGYQNGNSERAAQSRGQRSVSGGGAKRR